MENNQDVNTQFCLSEEAIQKKQLKTHANHIGLGVFLFYIFSSVFFIIMIPALKMLGLYSESLYPEGFGGVEPTSYYLLSGLFFIISLFVPFFVITKISNIRLSKIVPFEKIETKFLFSYIAVGLMVCTFANESTNQLMKNLNFIGIFPSLPEIPYDNHIFSIVLNFVTVAILPALMEEFVFRGVILGLLRKYGDGFAIVVSAAIFGLVHANIIQSSFAFIVGLILGYIVVKTNSLLPTIIIHFINNFFSILMDVFEKNLNVPARDILEFVTYLIFILLGSIGLIYLLQKEKNIFSISSSNSLIPFRKCLRCFVFSPFIIILIIMFAAFSLV